MTNDFHNIRLREIKRECDFLAGVPANQIQPVYFTPSLKEICAKVIADNFESLNGVDSLKAVDEELYNLVVDQLRTDLKLEVALRVHSDDYWRACCETRWSVGQLTSFTPSGKLEPPIDGKWKRLYLERNLEEFLMCISSPTMAEDDEAKMVRLCQDCSSTVKSLKLTHQRCHFDVHELFSKLTNLQEFSLTYSVLNASVNFKLNMIGMNPSDAVSLQRVLKTFTGLSSLSLPGNRIDANILKALVAGLVKNSSLTALDLSHNKIDDEGVAALSLVLMKKDIRLQRLDLSDNMVRVEGAKSLGRALTSNATVKSLSLRLNRLSDAGGEKLFDKISSNSTLTFLDVSSNDLGSDSARALHDALSAPTSCCALTSIDLSGNRFSEECGGLIVAAVTCCLHLTTVEVRSSGIGATDVAEINRITRERVFSNKMKEISVKEAAQQEMIEKTVMEKVRKTHGI